MCVYLDDILVTGESEAAHFHNLSAVLEQLEAAGVRLKREKCSFMLQEVEYLGHRISSRGLQPLASKVQAIQEAPTPKDVSQLRSFLGLLNYYGRFLPDLATLLSPLYELLQSSKRWKWEQRQDKAFQEAKKLLATSDVLTHYDPRKPLVLSCDASPYGVGAVLSHCMPDDTEQPIAFASRSLSPAERKYAQLDKEALAIIFGVKRFHQYLYGRNFTILSDHKPLQYLLGQTRGIPAMASARIQRWALTLSAYSYTIGYKPGAAHANADGLSRLPLPEQLAEVPLPGEMVLLFEALDSTPIRASKIREWIDKDPLLSRVRDNVRRGWHTTDEAALQSYQLCATELSIRDGCLLRGSRVVVPKQGRQAVMDLLHNGYPRVTQMKRLARGYVWWPGIDVDLETAVKSCCKCQEHQNLPARAPMHPWEWPDRPWARLHVDYAGPIQGKMILVVIDTHSKWLEAQVVAAATSQSTIEKLRMLFATHGLPETIVSDNGSLFKSAEFALFMNRNAIQHLTSAPYHPASNGLAERAVQTLKGALRKEGGGESLETRIARFLFTYRITPHTTTGIAPAELLMNRRPRSRLDLLHPDVSGRIKMKQQKQKVGHDYHCHKRTFTEEQPIWTKNHASGQPWLSGTLTKLVSPERFLVQLEDGRTVDRHIDHCRPRVPVPQNQEKQPIFPDSELCGNEQVDENPTADPAPLPRRSTLNLQPPDRLM